MKIPVIVRMVYYGLIDLSKFLLVISAVLSVTFGILWAMANLEIVEMVVSYIAGTLLVLMVLGFTIVYLFGLHERSVRANNNERSGP